MNIARKLGVILDVIILEAVLFDKIQPTFALSKKNELALTMSADVSFVVYAGLALLIATLIIVICLELNWERWQL